MRRLARCRRRLPSGVGKRPNEVSKRPNEVSKRKSKLLSTLFFKHQNQLFVVTDFPLSQ